MQNRTTPKLKQFARQLLNHEVASGKTAGASGALAFRVCDKLRPPLSKLMGTAGFRALFTRALVLARAEVPWLETLQVKPDGCMEGLTDAVAKLDPDVVLRGELALVTQLLGLLITFIGPALTLALVKEAWPEAAFDEMSFEEGEKL